MPETKLYMAPGTCARVSAICLEEADIEFESVVVQFLKGEHKSPEFKKLNPKSKVPTLVIDGEPLHENVAIISYLNERFPEAALLPTATNALERSRQLADLCFCSATLHPLVARIRVPEFFAAEESARQKHTERMETRPAVQRALAREKVAQETLEKEGLVWVPKVPIATTDRRPAK